MIKPTKKPRPQVVYQTKPVTPVPLRPPVRIETKTA